MAVGVAVTLFKNKTAQVLWHCFENVHISPLSNPQCMSGDRCSLAFRHKPTKACQLRGTRQRCKSGPYNFSACSDCICGQTDSLFSVQHQTSTCSFVLSNRVHREMVHFAPNFSEVMTLDEFNFLGDSRTSREAFSSKSGSRWREYESPGHLLVLDTFRNGGVVSPTLVLVDTTEKVTLETVYVRTLYERMSVDTCNSKEHPLRCGETTKAAMVKHIPLWVNESTQNKHQTPRRNTAYRRRVTPAPPLVRRLDIYSHKWTRKAQKSF